jgi:ribonuclease BN (tRNA processing enzyme)
MPRLIKDFKTYELKNPGKWTIQGHSCAADCTGFILQPLNIGLDAGIKSNKTFSSIFLTHTHSDHSQNLHLQTYFFPKSEPEIGWDDENDKKLFKLVHQYGNNQWDKIAEEMKNFNKKQCKKRWNIIALNVFMPKSAEKPIQKFMEGVIALNPRSSIPFDYSDPINIWKRQGYYPQPVEPLQIIKVPNLMANYSKVTVEILKAYHVVDSVGYGFTTYSMKLKDKFRCEKCKNEKSVCDDCKDILKKAKKNKEIIVEEKPTYEFVFFCDSTIDNLKNHSEWKKYPVIMCECTGYPEISGTSELMYERGHTHLDDLLPIMLENIDKHWILLHASLAIKNEQLIDFEKKLKNEYNLNITIINL